jgi:hypothetical protein
VGEGLAETIRHMFRLDEDLSGFYALVGDDPELGWCVACAGRMLRAPAVFEDVVKTNRTPIRTYSCGAATSPTRCAGSVAGGGEKLLQFIGCVITGCYSARSASPVVMGRGQRLVNGSLIGVAGVGIYDAAKTGAKAGIQQVKGKLSGPERPKNNLPVGYVLSLLTGLFRPCARSRSVLSPRKIAPGSSV